MIEQKPTAVIIGCGRTGQLLIQKLKDSWQLVIIEKESAEIKKLKSKYSDTNIIFHEGDATSYIELKKAGVAKAYQILVTVDKDSVSNEILKILINRFKKTNIVCRISDSNTANQLRKKGVFVVTPYETMANMIINQMNLGEIVALNIGKGEGEIIQIELTKSSPLVGKPLRDLPPRPWLIGAIYRPKKKILFQAELPYFQKFQISKEDNLIIPSGSSVPKVGDKLILIGDPHILRSTAQYLKAGAPVFPIRHGSLIVNMFLSKHIKKEVLNEYYWLLNKMEPAKMRFLTTYSTTKDDINELQFPAQWDKKNNKDPFIEKKYLRNIPNYFSNLLSQRRIGLVIYAEPDKFIQKIKHKYLLIPSLLKIFREAQTPLWIIRNYKEVKQVSLVVSSDEGALPAAELAVDAALKLNIKLRIVQVNPPSLIAGNVQLEKAKKMMHSVREIAALYGITVTENILIGNPVNEVLKVVDKEELLVVSLPKNSKAGVFIPNSAKLLMKKFPGSLLVLST
ncbi:MAG: NAD-binding protein [Spirochaetia bacterium]|nr:NAD-binding protein [Spirochaetia bacterium]